MKHTTQGRAVREQLCDDWSATGSEPARPKKKHSKPEPVGLIISLSLGLSAGLMMMVAHFLG